MKKTLILLSLFICIIVAVMAARPLFSRIQNATAAPEVFSSGIHAGCYIAAPNSCKIHVDPFTIDLDDKIGKLLEFQIRANGAVIYHFKTDSDETYIPVGDYQPSLVMLDFAAECGKSYTINLVAKDDPEIGLVDVATTGQFTCPSSVP